MVEGCVGKTVPFSATRWYIVPGESVRLEGRFVSGYWSPDGFIVLAESLSTNGSLVRHEMLHAIIGKSGHSRTAFLESCAGIVNCSADCVQDAGTWEAPSPYTVVPRESIEVSVIPQIHPTEADGQRWVSLTVRARNPGGAALVDVGALQGFGYAVSGPDGAGISVNVPVSDSSTLFFLPNSYKEWVFDFLVSDRVSLYTLPSGRNMARGGFGQIWSPAIPFDVPSPAASGRVAPLRPR